MNSEISIQKRTLQTKKDYMENRIQEIYQELDNLSERTTIFTVILAIFLLGIHRILSRKLLSGIIYMFTCGGFFIWMLYDIIIIGMGKFKDKNGKCINSFKRDGLEVELVSLQSEIEEIDKELIKLNY